MKMKIAGGIILLTAACGSAYAQRAVGGSVASHERMSVGSVGIAHPFGDRAVARGPYRSHGSSHERHGRHRGGHKGLYAGFGAAWGDGDSYVSTQESADIFGFYGAGGEVTFEDGQAIYDYDRSYPYEWFEQDRVAEPRGQTVSYATTSDYRCETLAVPAASGTGRVPVRVCRR